jgi:hypothetical protein
MNKFFLFASLLLAQAGIAQNSVAPSSAPTPATALKFTPLDKSPMDMAYYPANYPVLKIQDKATEPLVARVIYSRPQKEGRNIFGELVEYGKIWRFGANEATEIELFREVRMGDKRLPKGRYSIYAIPTETKWTIIFNRDTDSWGAFKYDEKKDVLRLDVPVQNSGTTVDPFTIMFNKATGGAEMVIAWDNSMVTVPMAFK